MCETFTNEALERLQDWAVDAYDVFVINAITNGNGSQNRLPEIRNGIKVLTDDGDFATVEDFIVYTANQTVVRKARDQERLIETIN